MKNPPGIDPSLTFHPLNIAVLTVSDTRNKDTDTSGACLADRAASAGHRIVEHCIVRDDVVAIREAVARWIASDEVDVILTTGGTGFSPRDMTPEAIKPLFSR